MHHHTELDTFLSVWNSEAEHTLRVIEKLPEDQYDFRPDPDGRSLGELAWHLSEIDACLSLGIATDQFSFEDVPPHLTRPKEISLLAPGYRLIHEEAVERIKDLEPGRMDETVTFFDGSRRTVRDVLWVDILHHLIHHRGQLVMLCRQAGGVPPGVYGPNREEMRAMME